MGWVDVDDGVIAINHGQARQDVGNAVDTITAPVRAVGEGIDNVSDAVDDFQTKGQQQGYGEAIWQDVVQPIGEVSGVTKGTIIGAGGALAKDLIDPTPGINPANIIKGGAYGAVAGAAMPYAYDAVEALSSPNSIMRGDTWNKAGEGLGIASGVTNPNTGEQDFNPIRIQKNIGEGIENMYHGGLAGANQLGADIQSILPGLDDDSMLPVGYSDVIRASGFPLASIISAGMDKMGIGQPETKPYNELAEGRRASMNNPNSAVGAVGEELVYDAGMGAAIGKGVDVIKGAGEGLNAMAKSGAIKRASKYINDTADNTAKLFNRKPTKAERTKVVDSVKNKDTMWLGTRALTDLIGSFSTSTQSRINTLWDTFSSRTLGSGKASVRDTSKMLSNLADAGMSKADAKVVMQSWRDNPDAWKKFGASFAKPVGTGTVKLFGSGTGIFADSNDNATTRPYSQKLGL